jgi:hypothetical protein
MLAPVSDDEEEITPEKMEAAERDGLCDNRNLTLFATWYALGGSERGLTLGEIKNMSAAELKDFGYMLRVVGRILKRQAKQRKRES